MMILLHALGLSLEHSWTHASFTHFKVLWPILAVQAGQNHLLLLHGQARQGSGGGEPWRKQQRCWSRCKFFFRAKLLYCSKSSGIVIPIGILLAAWNKAFINYFIVYRASIASVNPSGLGAFLNFLVTLVVFLIWARICIFWPNRNHFINLCQGGLNGISSVG